jgi:tetratricopeptide (TPR) repeat protein
LGEQGRTPWSTDDGEAEVDDAAAAKTGALDPGEVLGRYVVLYRLGTGGMGVVYAAYDPELDRKVALKLLRRGSKNPKRRRRARQRLLREARAMARLSHPNVITVHDVAVYGGRVFMAMEHIEGVTLARGLAGDGMPWPKVLEVMIKAGRGLVAAHDAGLVHRDFKPDNVMLAKDGRVVVMDFGLARALEHDPAENSLRISGDVGRATAQAPPKTPLANLVPVEGAGSNLAGTPAYMAPEQRQGEPTDARVDQFSFCVSMYEALYRQRPFRGGDADEIARKIADAQIEAPPANSKVPNWLRAVVLRGLSRDPSHRFGSMQELLAALERDPVARRRRWLRWGAVGTAIAATAAGLALAFVPTGPDACGGGEERLAGVWDAERRAQVDRAFQAVERPYAADAWERVAQSLDTYGGQWLQMQREACEANRVRGEQSDDLFDLRMECLGRRRAELAALSDVFAEADASVVQQAVDATAKLTPIEVCSDVDRLRTPVPLPDDPQLRDRIEAVRERLARGKAQLDAGQFEHGLSIIDPVVIEARDIDHAPLLAEALYLQGRLQHQTGDVIAADRTLREAANVAARGKHDEMAARIWTLLAMAMAQGQGKADAATELAEIAAAAVERAGGSSTLRAELANATGGVMMAKADFEGAQQQFEKALEYQRETVGEAHPSLARYYNNLAAAYGQRGNLDQSQRFLERALEIQERNVGPDHPNVAVYLGNLGVIRSELGQEGALEAIDRAIDIWRRSFRGDHPALAQALNNKSRLLFDDGDLEGAEEVLRESLEMQERLQSEHPNTARAMTNMAMLLTERGHADQALSWAERGLAMTTKLLGDDHPERALALAAVGTAYLGQDNLAEAIPRLEDAYALREQATGLGMRLDVARSGLDLARALLRRDAVGDRRRAERVLIDTRGRIEDVPATPAALKVRAQIAELLAEFDEPAP